MLGTPPTRAPTHQPTIPRVYPHHPPPPHTHAHTTHTSQPLTRTTAGTGCSLQPFHPHAHTSTQKARGISTIPPPAPPQQKIPQACTQGISQLIPATIRHMQQLSSLSLCHLTPAIIAPGGVSIRMASHISHNRQISAGV